MVHKYEHIAKDMRRRLGDPKPEWKVGERLPSLSELKEYYGVGGVQTVRSALEILVQEDLIESRQGSGAFVLRIPEPREHEQLLDDLRRARAALSRAITQLEALQ